MFVHHFYQILAITCLKSMHIPHHRQEVPMSRNFTHIASDRAQQAKYRRRYAVRAKSVGEFVPKLMRPAFEKYGFPAAALLTEWPAIAGPELARYTAPERLKWPRPNRETGETGCATLVLRVAGARALEVEQMRPQLIARINANFGYRAVADIRILQAPLPEREETPKRVLPPAEPIPELEDISEPRLQAAFSRMASAIGVRQDDK
jgi:hypothetical protein